MGNVLLGLGVLMIGMLLMMADSFSSPTSTLLFITAGLLMVAGTAAQFRSADRR